MSHTSTHTYATMKVSSETFHEIHLALKKAGYDHAIHDDSKLGQLLDMNGIGLITEGSPTPNPDLSRFAHYLFDLIKNQAKWSQETFGPDNVRGPIGPLKHMIKEVEECLKDPKNVKEYADLLILFLDATRRAGITPIEWLSAARLKHLENTQRQWPKVDPSKDEAVEHIRDEEPSQPASEKAQPVGHSQFHEVALGLQDWINSIYGSSDSTPIVNWMCTPYTDSLSVGEFCIWDRESGYACATEVEIEFDHEPALEACKIVYASLVLQISAPFLASKVPVVNKESFMKP